MKKAFIIFICAIHVLTSTGCASMQPLDTTIDEKGLKGTLNSGDMIIIHTRPHGEDSGGQYQVVVDSILENKIIAYDVFSQNNLEFYYSDISTIEIKKEQPDAGPVVYLAFVLILIALLADLPPREDYICFGANC